MKMINKKVLTTTIAATVLLGGGAIGLLQSDAFADEPTATATPSKPADSDTAKKEKALQERHWTEFKTKFNFKDGNLLKETAAILGLDEKALVEKLKAGQTLSEIAQAAGVSEADLLQKLTDAATKKLDEAVAAGKLTQEQADKLKADLSAKLKEGITTKGIPFGPGPGMGGPGHPGKPGFDHGFGFGRGGMGFGVFGNEEQLATILGMTKEELKAARDAGKSLAEIAQEKGITEEALIGKLKDAMTDGLKKFVESKPQSKPELKEKVQELKEKAQDLKQKLQQRRDSKDGQPQQSPQPAPQQQKWKPSASTSVSNT